VANDRSGVPVLLFSGLHFFSLYPRFASPRYHFSQLTWVTRYRGPRRSNVGSKFKVQMTQWLRKCVKAWKINKSYSVLYYALYDLCMDKHDESPIDCVFQNNSFFYTASALFLFSKFMLLESASR
jgi:hypothetical protein